ncbi:3-dehydroquinate synthase [Desulfovibrio aerotolerans]|uniref:3-dehydroquinate synthase n=1 Tax=Solidesulfovibrio aerotolerans TaxID=295255 RepID=A0A7C9IJ68_9BACT|nr:3-dehydroquinate synthase [Solidesulfovibrio aerotolerans]MYL82005.1 3-dehydroquinate synthase [Solidesulfovibrio aerotolerans]
MTVAIPQHIALAYDFPVIFTRRVFDPGNPVLADVLARAGEGPHKVGVVLDAGLAAADPTLPARVAAYAAAHSRLLTLVEAPLVVPGGEMAKADFAVVEAVWELTFRAKLCRQSFVLAIGGGAVLDAAGFGAATAHRGVRLLRLPSTVLAQNDAGVGVKNGINYFGRKNYLGTFAPPYAVINDHALLATLPAREIRAGLAEAVKVALVRDALFFTRLQELAPRLGVLDDEALLETDIRCAEAHLQHIAGGGDPFELGSARPLDFGHWAAHALEEATGGALRHGEAVAVGVALDTLYSSRLGLLAPAEAEAVLTLLTDLGLAVWHPALAALDMAGAIEAFREHLGGRLHLCLLAGIGRRLEVHEVDLPRLDAARQDLAARAASACA